MKEEKTMSWLEFIEENSVDDVLTSSKLSTPTPPNSPREAMGSPRLDSWCCFMGRAKGGAEEARARSKSETKIDDKKCGSKSITIIKRVGK